MKNLILVVLLLGGFLIKAQHHEDIPHEKATLIQQYTCPMHPEVISDKPGKCPKCGMDLVPMVKAKKTEESDILQRNSKAGKVDFDGKVVRYDLYVTDTIVNYTGKNRRAIAINGQLPAPTLYFTEGDIAEIYLHNRLKKESTGLHWHGVMLENKEDGVPFLTQMPVKVGEDYVYRFKVSQNGTYWYHSHQGLQEQIGMYGVLVFKKRGDSAIENSVKADIPVILSEWSDENPREIMRRLHTGQTEWYAIKKKSVQSYSEAIASGNFWTKLKNEWLRMEAMDISDVYYNKFLLNGKTSSDYQNLRAGDKVRLRIANGGASSYFWLNYGGGKMTVVASDGNEMEPVEVDRLIVGVSETYDIEVTVPENKSFEFRATSEDRTGHASLWLGNGEKVEAPTLQKLMLFEGMKNMNAMMLMSGNMKPMNMEMGLQQMDMNAIMYPEVPKEERQKLMQHMKDMMQPMPKMEHKEHNESSDLVLSDSSEHHMDMPQDHSKHGEADASKNQPPLVTLNYGMLRSPEMTSLPTDAPVKELNFVLEGNMHRYLWTLDNKTVTEADKILIKKGEVVRIKMYNNSMMRHPMHLHGHDFRIVNANGDYSPSKNVMDIMPMETNIIEFPANQDGDWFFHCHILYHMMAGMGRVMSYENSAPNPNLPDPKKAWSLFKQDNRMKHYMGMLAVESSSIHAEAMVGTARYALQSELHAGYEKDHGYEAEFKFGRYLGKFQWAFPYIGFQSRNRIGEHGMHGMMMNRKTMFGQNAEHNQRNVFTVGMQYTLPWLVTADASVDQTGKVRLQLQREDIPLTPRIRGNFMVNTDREYRLGLRYILQKWVSISSHYDSDMGWGAGFTFNY